MIQASINSKCPKWYVLNRTYQIQVPQNWQEMTESQVLAVMPILMGGEEEAESLPFLVKAVLSSVPKHILYKMDETVMYEKFYKRLSWVYHRPILSPKPSLISQDGVVYQLPKEKLKSLTIQQYYECDEAVNQYLKSAKEEQLQRFLQSFLTPLSKEECSNFGELEEVYKFYSLYYFLSCRDWISKEFFDFDPKNKKNNIVKNASVRRSYDWRTGLLSIAETGIFGNHAQVVQTPCHDIFRYLKMKNPKVKHSTDLRDIIRANHQKYSN